MSIQVEKITKEDSLQCKCCCIRRETINIKINGDYGFSNGITLCDKCATSLVFDLQSAIEGE